MLVARIKSNFKYLSNNFFANSRFKDFLIVFIPFFLAISAEFVGSIPSIFEDFFFLKIYLFF